MKVQNTNTQAFGAGNVYVCKPWALPVSAKAVEEAGSALLQEQGQTFDLFIGTSTRGGKEIIEGMAPLGKGVERLPHDTMPSNYGGPTGKISTFLADIDASSVEGIINSFVEQAIAVAAETQKVIGGLFK